LGIYEGLKPHCDMCHGEGTSFPAFGSFTSFQNLITYNPRVIVPGEPEDSGLIAFLEGRALGEWSSMPTSKAYLKLQNEGVTQITIEEIETWIAGLKARPELPTRGGQKLSRRLRSEQIVASLYQQLGLEESDFFTESGAVNNQSLPILDPNRVMKFLGNERNIITWSRYGGAGSSFGLFRWQAIGGPDFRSGVPSNVDTGETFGLMITQISLGWCRMSIRKKDNNALFKYANKKDGSDVQKEQIRKNINYLYLRMLGVIPDTSQTDDMVAVFEHYEAIADVESAWVGVCSAFIRHPLWITY